MFRPSEKELADAYSVIIRRCYDIDSRLLSFMYLTSLRAINQSPSTPSDLVASSATLATCPKCGMPEVNPVIGFLCAADDCEGKKSK